MKKPWFIWGSYVAFLGLWLNTHYRVNGNKIGNKSWEWKNIHPSFLKAAGELFFTVIVLFLLPVLAFSLLFSFVLVPASGSAFEVIACLVIAVVSYLSGVYAAYRHYCWRCKYLQ